MNHASYVPFVHQLTVLQEWGNNIVVFYSLLILYFFVYLYFIYTQTQIYM